MANHWSEYWLQGHLTSFGDSFKGNYDGVLKDVWATQFESLTEGFSVLDIATGNGAIPLLVRDYVSEGVQGNVKGVDLAKVQNTAEILKESTIGIELLSEVNCEQLSFDDEVFDLVVSQFGIEYSDMNISLGEALRVCKTNGHLCFVMHHHDSLVIRRNRNILNIISEIYRSNLLNILADLIEAMGEVRNPDDLSAIKKDAKCEELRKGLNAQVNILVNTDEQALKDSELMTYLASIFKGGLFWSLNKKREYLQFINQQLEELKQRLKELVGAAVDERKLALLLENISESNAKLLLVEALRNDDKQVLAWNLHIQKGL